MDFTPFGGIVGFGLVVFLLLKFLPSKEAKVSLSSTATQSFKVIEDSVLIGREAMMNSSIQARAELIDELGGVDAYNAKVAQHFNVLENLRSGKAPVIFATK